MVKVKSEVTDMKQTLKSKATQRIKPWLKKGDCKKRDLVTIELPHEMHDIIRDKFLLECSSDLDASVAPHI